MSDAYASYSSAFEALLHVRPGFHWLSWATPEGADHSSGSGAQVTTKDTEKHFEVKPKRNNNNKITDCVHQAPPADAVRVSGPAKVGGTLTTKNLYLQTLEKEGFIYIGTKFETKLKCVPWHERKKEKEENCECKIKVRRK